MTRRVALLVLGASLTPLLLAPAIVRGGTGQTHPKLVAAFDHVLSTAGAGKIRVGGPLRGCPSGVRVTIRFTVSERSTEALAEGTFKGACTGKTKHWKSAATARGGASFASGAGQACGLSIAREGTAVVDIFQWCAHVRIAAG